MFGHVTLSAISIGIDYSVLKGHFALNCITQIFRVNY